jgi:uncharacterized coiled-coil protein SlyX
MFMGADAFNQVFCWDLGEIGSPDSDIHTGPQGSEYTDGVCACPVGSVSVEGMGNNGVCIVPTPVPTAVPTPVPTYESSDTPALMALIEGLRSDVTSLQSTLSAMSSTVSSQEVRIAQNEVRISDQQSTISDLQSTLSAMSSTDSSQELRISDQEAFTEDLTAVVEDHAVQMAGLRAVIDTVKHWKQKVRHGTDKLSTHKVTTGDKQQQGNMRGSDEMIEA